MFSAASFRCWIELALLASVVDHLYISYHIVLTGAKYDVYECLTLVHSDIVIPAHDSDTGTSFTIYSCSFYIVFDTFSGWNTLKVCGIYVVCGEQY